MFRLTTGIFRHLAYCTGLIACIGTVTMAAELKWHFYASEDVAQAFFSDCTNCDGARFSAVCTKGQTVTLIPTMNVKGGKAGETRNVTFLFGDGAVDVKGELVANDMDGTIEPEVAIPIDHEILQHMRNFESVEVMVDRGPALVVSLKGADTVISKLQAYCRD